LSVVPSLYNISKMKKHWDVSHRMDL